MYAGYSALFMGRVLLAFFLFCPHFKSGLAAYAQFTPTRGHTKRVPLAEAPYSPLLRCFPFDFNARRVQHSLPSVYTRTSACHPGQERKREKDSLCKKKSLPPGIERLTLATKTFFEDTNWTTGAAGLWGVGEIFPMLIQGRRRARLGYTYFVFNHGMCMFVLDVVLSCVDPVASLFAAHFLLHVHVR
ncbi:unnamed protein product [Ectocarpus sp. 8 AP-2014]